jgi:hypothetical protein
MTAADALANRPLVQSEEGRRLARLLKPLPERSAPKLSLATELDLREFSESDREETLSMQPTFEAPAVGETTGPAILWWPADEAAGTSPAEPESPFAQHSFAADFRSEPHSPREEHRMEGGEPDLIVLEDEAPGVHQVTVVRRNQYRQLFSNLRRG